MLASMPAGLQCLVAMAVCRNCRRGGLGAEVIFCPYCGHDQRVDAPRLSPPQGGPGTWVGQGVGWSLGSCLFACLVVFLVFFVLPFLLLAACGLLGAVAGAA